MSTLLSAVRAHLTGRSEAIPAGIFILAAAAALAAGCPESWAQGGAPMPEVQRPGGYAPMPMVQVPSHSSTREAVAMRGSNGHFVINTFANGTNMPMLFDTGASSVVLRAEDAVRMGINVGSLNYSVKTQTANGDSVAAPVVISSLSIGDITVRDVPAVVVKPGQLFHNLLGQSFMMRLASHSVEGDRLTMRSR